MDLKDVSFEKLTHMTYVHTRGGMQHVAPVDESALRARETAMTMLGRFAYAPASRLSVVQCWDMWESRPGEAYPLRSVVLVIPETVLPESSDDYRQIGSLPQRLIVEQQLPFSGFRYHAYKQMDWKAHGVIYRPSDRDLCCIATEPDLLSRLPDVAYYPR